MDSVDEILEHYGVKGMHWGVRKASSLGPQAVSVKAQPGKKIKTSGGANHGASREAKKTATTRQIAKKSHVSALSNKDLQDAVKRMQLEQQFNQLNHQRKNAGARFISGLLGKSGKQSAEAVAQKSTTKLVAKTLAKTAVLA